MNSTGRGRPVAWPALLLGLGVLLPGVRCEGPYAGPFVVELRDLVVRFHPATAEPRHRPEGGRVRVCFALELESRSAAPLEVMLLAASTTPATRVVDASARFPGIAPGGRAAARGGSGRAGPGVRPGGRPGTGRGVWGRPLYD